MSEYPMDNRQVEAFLRHYRGQYGYGFPVYRGERFQSGNGLGDILRGIGRFLVPLFAPVAHSFMSSTVRGMDEGLGIKDAAKGAIKPTIATAIVKGVEQLNKMKGSGRRRRKSKRKVQRRGGKRKRTVYKSKTGAGRKRKSSTKPRRIRKRVRVLSPSFANF